jgi:hypothetical protein
MLELCERSTIEGFFVLSVEVFLTHESFLPDFKHVKVFPFTVSDFPALVHLAPCFTAAFAPATDPDNKRISTDMNATNFLLAEFIFSCL